MNREDFFSYCKQFSEDKTKIEVFDKYYQEDTVFNHPKKGVFKGKDEIVSFWTQGHKGIHEIIKPVSVLFDEDKIAAEIDIEWHCFEDTEYLGPRKKGDVFKASCAAFYHLRDGKFDSVKLYLRDL